MWWFYWSGSGYGFAFIKSCGFGSAYNQSGSTSLHKTILKNLARKSLLPIILRQFYKVSKIEISSKIGKNLGAGCPLFQIAWSGLTYVFPHNNRAVAELLHVEYICSALMQCSIFSDELQYWRMETNQEVSPTRGHAAIIPRIHRGCNCDITYQL